MNTPRINVAGVILRNNKLLLAEYNDASGIHYNFPGGGVHLGETLHDAVKREVWEETGARVTVGKLMAVWEYIPPEDDPYGNVHKIGHLFNCELVADSEPNMPEQPDPSQVGIRWVSLEKLDTIQLYPELGQDLHRIIRGELDNVFYGKV